MSLLIKDIKSPALAYGLNLAWASLVVVAVFLFQETLALLGEDWSEHVSIVFLATGTLMLTGRCATIKCILFGIMGFQNGIVVPVLLIGMATDYQIDWVKVWIVLVVVSLVTFVTALILRHKRRRKQKRNEGGDHG